MKIDSRKDPAPQDQHLQELSLDEIETVSGGSFAIARPGQVNAAFFGRQTGPMAGGYVFA